MGNLREALRERKAAPRETTSVTVPDMGLDEPVILQKLLYGELKDVYSGGKDATDFPSVMLSRMVVDKDGQREFTDKEKGYFDALPAKAFRVLMDAANKLNGFGEDEVAATLKNSETGQSGDSESALPATSESSLTN